MHPISKFFEHEYGFPLKFTFEQNGKYPTHSVLRHLHRLIRGGCHRTLPWQFKNGLKSRRDQVVQHADIAAAFRFRLMRKLIEIHCLDRAQSGMGGNLMLHRQFLPFMYRAHPLAWDMLNSKY
jgi:hypothetical protein